VYSMTITTFLIVILCTVVGALSPVVTVRSTISTKLNVESQLHISGGIVLAGLGAGYAVWSLNEASVDLAAISLGPISSYVSGAATLDLLLRRNSLPAGQSLTFTLSCTDGGSSAVASILIVTNAPPLPGSIAVSPISGVELSTIYSFSASSWSDPDLPVHTHSLETGIPSGAYRLIISCLVFVTFT
jgi:hypothetical protein